MSRTVKKQKTKTKQYPDGYTSYQKWAWPDDCSNQDKKRKFKKAWEIELELCEREGINSIFSDYKR